MTTKTNAELISAGIESRLSSGTPSVAAARYRRLADELTAELQWAVANMEDFSLLRSAIDLMERMEAEALGYITEPEGL